MEQSILKIARELAQTIAASDEYRIMRMMDEESLHDSTLSNLYSEYTQKRGMVEEMTLHDNLNYDEIGAATRELEEIQSRIQAMPLMQKLTQARHAFSEMMNQVNLELQFVLSPGQSCGSGCDTCGGCHNH
jgi:cell fate (sporulation/competence/biofilm development) regulator YlbF (YheA/YmcA/DUF963 family)